MPHRHASRREPRILALEFIPQGIRFAVVDLFEVRSTGEFKTTPRHFSLELQRLLAREKPTVIVTPTPESRSLLRHARRLRIPLLLSPSRRLSGPAILALYPEVSFFGPTRPLRALLATSIAALLYAPHPSRGYASRSTPTPSR